VSLNAHEKKTEVPVFETIIIMATKDEEIALTGMAAGSSSVMAPSDMPGGYEFFADAGNGSSYKVRVVRTEAKERKRLVMPAGCLSVCLVAVLCVLIIAYVDEILAVDGLLPRPSITLVLWNVWALKKISCQSIGREPRGSIKNCRTKKRTTHQISNDRLLTLLLVLSLSLLIFLHA
jgi:hypothetical protein